MLLFATLILLSPPALLEGDPSATSPEPLTAEDCPAIFGDEDIWRRNTLRRALVADIERNAGRVEITHSAKWLKISEFAFDDLEIVETAPARSVAGYTPELGPPGGYVTARLSDPLADRMGCEAGDYTLNASQGLGGGTRILGVMDDLILIEHQRSLGFVMAEGAPPPAWRLVWRSAYTMPRPSMGSQAVSVSAGTTTRSTSRRRATRARRRYQRNRRRR